MARSTGPACRVCRRAGMKLFLKGERCFGPKCGVERRNQPPGQRSTRRRKQSERGMQLREKQKARAVFGVLERQFRRYFAEADRRPGMTGENLLQLLERRLDNVVYRLGFADSRRQARQLVNHGHFTINGRKTDIPSALVRPGNVIAWTPSGLRSEYYKTLVESLNSKEPPPPWLALDKATVTGRVEALPERKDMEPIVNEQVIVEFYAR